MFLTTQVAGRFLAAPAANAGPLRYSEGPLNADGEAEETDLSASGARVFLAPLLAFRRQGRVIGKITELIAGQERAQRRCAGSFPSGRP